MIWRHILYARDFVAHKLKEEKTGSLQQSRWEVERQTVTVSYCRLVARKQIKFTRVTLRRARALWLVIYHDACFYIHEII